MKHKFIFFLLFIASTGKIAPTYDTKSFTCSLPQSYLTSNSYNNPFDTGKNILSQSAHLPHRYTANQFKHYFDKHGYTEQQILSQHALYLSNEFVKLVKTYQGYEKTINNLHKELATLSRCKKILRTLTGSYYPGLKKRINFLYNEIHTQQTPQPNQNKICSQKINTFNSSNFHEQIADYETLDSVYRTYTPSLATAIDKRLNAYNAITNGKETYTTTTYKLDDSSIKLLHYYEHNTAQFSQCTGNQLRHIIHQESLDILKQISHLSFNSVLYDHQEALVDCITSACNYNQEGLINKAVQIADLCWTLLDYGQAVIEGAALGLYATVNDIIENPIEGTVCIIAGRQVLAYQLCKVLYNVADIGFTAITNLDEAQTKWNNYVEPLTALITAIQTKETSLRDVIKTSTALVVGWKAQTKLLGGLGKFCSTIKQNSIRFTKNNLHLNPQAYLSTPEGMLLKATIKQANQAPKALNIKNIVESKISKNKSIKGLLKKAGLPSKGKLRYVPPKKIHLSNRLPEARLSNGDTGFIDRFGNIWVKGDSRTKGQAFEWDVQLSKQGISQVGWMTRDNSHLNVSLDGRVTHK